MDPTAQSVESARDRYLAVNGFTLEGYSARWTPASFLGIPFVVPNTRRHQWAIKMHDLHHVATGYGTDIPGEGEISAWELRRGLGGLGFYVGSLVVLGTLAGLVFAPLRTVRAFRASRRSGVSLFHQGRPYEDLLLLDVRSLRAYLDVPAGGLGTTHALHAYAPRQPTVGRG
jgi:hypothetical protein